MTKLLHVDIEDLRIIALAKCSMKSSLCKQRMGILSVSLSVLLSTTAVGNNNLMKFACIKDARQVSIFASFQTDNSQQCCRRCAHVSDCNTVNYHGQSSSCELISSTVQNGFTTSDSGWTVCYKTNVTVSTSCIGNSCSCIGRSCFAAVTNETSWEDASNYCLQSYGGHLADIRSARIQSLLSKMFPYRGKVERVWIGGTDKVMEGVFKWSDGNVVSNGYHNWLPGQPFNSGGDERCLIVRVHENHGWNDATCSISAMSMCEF